MESFLTSFSLGWSCDLLWILVRLVMYLTTEICPLADLGILWLSREQGWLTCRMTRDTGPSHPHCPNQKQNNCQTCEWDHSRSSRWGEQPAEHRWMSKSNQHDPSQVHTSRITLLFPNSWVRVNDCFKSLHYGFVCCAVKAKGHNTLNELIHVKHFQRFWAHMHISY